MATFNAHLREDTIFHAEIKEDPDMRADFGSITEVERNTDYKVLRNKPSINGVELEGNKTAEELMLIGEISNAEILDIWNTVMTD